jgi:hypothetical protein
VHARTLLVNIPDPGAVVAEMVRLARPSGQVLFHEPDMIGCLCEPRHVAFDGLLELLVDTFQRDRADPFIGRRLANLMHDADLVDIHVEGRVTLLPHGHSRRTILPDLVCSLRPKILAHGLVTESKLERLDAGVRQHLRDPRVAMYDLFFLARARKPAASLSRS